MRDNLPKMLRAAAKEWREKNKVVATGSTRYDAALEEAADAIEELNREKESLEKDVEIASYVMARRWISVTERLPEKDGTFITAYSKGGVSQNWYMTFHRGGGKWYQNSEDTGEVTHWMPLPEPPKEDEIS